MKKLLFFVSEDWYFCSHRLELAVAAKQSGFDVYVMCKVTKHRHIIEAAGIKVLELEINRASFGIVSNIRLLYQVIALVRKIRPDIMHNVAQKPVILGSIAAKICRVERLVNALGGLGFVFSSSTRKAKVIKSILPYIYNIVLRNAQLIVQNRDDRDYFLHTVNLPSDLVHLVPGAGVDTTRFEYCELPETATTRVVLVARMLKEKGIAEYINAAKKVRGVASDVEFYLVGDIDPLNPHSFGRTELEKMSEDAGVKWEGPSDDIFRVWASAHVSVLPTYREGLPKSLLESASVGRPIVTTNVTGAREVVQDHVNGFLVPAKSSELLSERILQLVNDRALCKKMGKESRRMVEESFSSKVIIPQCLSIYANG